MVVGGVVVGVVVVDVVVVDVVVVDEVVVDEVVVDVVVDVDVEVVVDVVEAPHPDMQVSTSSLSSRPGPLKQYIQVSVNYFSPYIARTCVCKQFLTLHSNERCL